MNNYIFLTSVSLINLIFILFFNKINNSLKLFDIPNNRKIHKEPVPCNGGVYLMINIFLLIFFYKSIYLNSQNLFLNLSNFYSFFITSLLIFILGVIDDLVDLSALKKTLYLLLLIVVALLVDNSLEIKTLNFSFIETSLYLKKFSILFSALSIFLFITAFNMFDGTNSQAAIYSIIIILFFLLKTSYYYIFFPISLFFLFFIFFNARGKIFLGNNGALLISFIFSWFFIQFYNKGIIINADEIILIMLIPGLDLVRLFFIRTIDKRSFFIADNNHLHHILMKKFDKFKLQFLIFGLVLIPIIIFYFTKVFFISFFLGIIIYFLIIYYFNKIIKD